MGWSNSNGEWRGGWLEVWFDVPPPACHRPTALLDHPPKVIRLRRSDSARAQQMPCCPCCGGVRRLFGLLPPPSCPPSASFRQPDRGHALTHRHAGCRSRPQLDPERRGHVGCQSRPRPCRGRVDSRIQAWPTKPPSTRRQPRGANARPSHGLPVNARSSPRLHGARPRRGTGHGHIIPVNRLLPLRPKENMGGWAGRGVV